MIKKYISPLFAALLLMVCTSVFAQENTNRDTTVVKDILKEFEYTSFEDAAIKIKDSALISQHLIGVKWGYSVSNVHFSQDIDHKAIRSPKNLGVYYTYLHSLWKSMPYFGIQAGAEYTQTGCTIITGNEADAVETDEIYKNIQLQMLALFRVDFWKMRLMADVGPYLGYKFDSNIEGGIPSNTDKWGYGVMGGGGLAFVMHPFELHFTAHYKYNFSELYDPKIYSEEYWTYTHENQLSFSVGLFYRFKNKYYKKRSKN